MPEKCITLDNILYKDKHYRIDKIIFVDEKDIKKLEREGAVRRLVKPKIKRIVRPIVEKKKEIKIGAEKIKKYTYKVKKKKKRGKEKQYAYPKA